MLLPQKNVVMSQRTRRGLHHFIFDLRPRLFGFGFHSIRDFPPLFALTPRTALARVFANKSAYIYFCSLSRANI